MEASEAAAVQAYLRQKFGTANLRVMPRAKDPSAEVLIGDEFIGVVFRDDEDGDVSYDFHLTILQMDLPDPRYS
ncbi:MAG: DUF3126 family protein [Alphaproteobacteria bacterium]